MHEFDGVVDGRPEYRSDEMVNAAQEDDVLGAGIFDTRVNLHGGDGIFEESYSLPGYLARETGNGPSEVIDNQTGTPIESFASGMWRSQQYLPSTQPRYPWPDLNPFMPDYRQVVAQQDGLYVRDRPTDMPGPTMMASPFPAPPGQVAMVPTSSPAGDAVRIVDPMSPTMYRTGGAKPIQGLGALGDIMDDAMSAAPYVVAGVITGALLKYGYDYAKQQGWL